MKLIIGLGNPGTKYLKNRHNVGHLFIQDQRSKIKDQNCILLKTDCFMNNSGVFVKKIMSSEQGIGNNLYVVHDDLDITLGDYKIQFAKGPELHYGIQSIESELSTKDFWRIRIGVDARDSGQARMTGEKYVLQDFLPEERQILEGVFDEIYKELINKL